MKTTDYPILVVWSAEDEAYLSHVLGLPGCMADGKTREECVSNALVAIEEWIETAQALGREVPPPCDQETFDALHAKRVKEEQDRFNYHVEQAVREALNQIVPQIASKLEGMFADASRPHLVYRGQVTPWNFRQSGTGDKSLVGKRK